MTLEEFLNQTNPEEYDFKKEMSYYYECMHVEKLPYQDNKDSTDFIAEFDLYKVADADLKGTVKLFDCDSSNDTCELTTQIYKTLWDYDKDSENEIWVWEDRGRNTYLSSGGDTMNSFTTTRKVWGGLNEERAATAKPLINEFAKLTHTLGNFVLVPYGFNCARYCQT